MENNSNELINHKIVFNSDDSSLDFIHNWIQVFFEELQLYSMSNNEIEPWRIYSERPLLGLLAAGLVRSDKKQELTVLHEFGVYRKELNQSIYLGRCDLFVKKGTDHYLAEFKYINSKGGRNLFNSKTREEFIDQIHSQCKKYYDELKHQYSGPVYLICMVFNNIIFSNEMNFDKHIEAVKTYYPENHGQFFAYITLKEKNETGKPFSGLELYGKVYCY